MSDMIEDIRTFNKTITDEQRTKFAKKLGSTGTELFEQMLNVSSEEEAKGKVQEFIDFLTKKPLKAASLVMGMTSEQKEMVKKFRESIQA